MVKSVSSARLGIGSGSRGTISEARGIQAHNPPARPRSPLTSSGPVALRSSPSASLPARPADVAPSRGRAAAALAASASVSSLGNALSALEHDEFAASTRASRSSLLRTWICFHRAAHQHDAPDAPPFPLTALSIRRVGALFKAGKYQAFDNYAARAKA